MLIIKSYQAKIALLSLVLIVGMSLTACGSTNTPGANLTPTTGATTTAKTDETLGTEVTFSVAGSTIYGSLVVPPGKTGKLPAAVLISGSGPTDRDGNNPLIQGKTNSHLELARVLSDAGVVSLRYDKIGSGKTGLGNFAANPNNIGFTSFVEQAKAAYDFLKTRPEVDPNRIMVLGHSEGGLIALVLTQDLKSSNGIKALALVAPLSEPYLTTLRTQLAAQYDQAVKAGQVTKEQADKGLAELDLIIKTLMEKGEYPTITEPAFKQLFTPPNMKFFADVAKIDPQKIAEGITVPALLACAQKDSQVPCATVQKLNQAFQKNGKATFVELPNANHVLKVVEGTPNPAVDYGNTTLKFSPEMKDSLTKFVNANL
jgi:uncharacterized protein